MWLKRGAQIQSIEIIEAIICIHDYQSVSSLEIRNNFYYMISIGYALNYV